MTSRWRDGNRPHPFSHTAFDPQRQAGAWVEGGMRQEKYGRSRQAVRYPAGHAGAGVKKGYSVEPQTG